jgi:hypothetical protein
LSQQGPVLSIILAGNNLEETRHVRSSIHAQSIADRLELVLVLPRLPEIEEQDQLFEGLWGGQVVEAEIISRGAANAHGARTARAPIVVFCEDHCFPGRQWAEALVADHQGPWSAVGPQVRNANPGTLISCADFVISYGPWSRPQDAGETGLLPGHNSSYKVEVLRAHDQELEQVLDAETVLFWSLTEQEHRLFLSKFAVVHHLNFSLPGAFLQIHYLSGRQFATSRANSWKLWRRATYVVGAPLLPLIRTWRLRRCFGAADTGGAPWAAIPAVIIGLCSDALGQAMGYMFGSGGLERITADYEFSRVRYMRPAEKASLEDDWGLAP